MTPDLEMYLGSVLLGSTAAVLPWVVRPYFSPMFDAVETNLTEKLRRLRVSTKNLRRYLFFWMAAVGCSFVGIHLGLDSLVFAALASILLVSAPWALLRHMAARHRLKIEDQLADAMVTLAGAVRAGLSLAQSMEILAAECPKPINAEFQQIVAEYQLGKPLERTLVEAKHRLHSENFALFSAALLASYESGGRLNETIERIAQSVLELQRLQRKVTSETAQARKSAVYMAIVPAFILGIYYFIDPINTTLLFTTTIGQILLATALVLNIVAYLWGRVILNPNI